VNYSITLLIDNIKIWNTAVIAVEWNKPVKIPIPLFKNRKFKLSYEIKIETIKIVIVALGYSIDLSCLKVIELDNNSKIIDRIVT
jgi:hypothetical protein